MTCSFRFLVLLMLFCSNSGADDASLIYPVNIVSVESGQVTRSQAVLVSGETIKEIVPATELEALKKRHANSRLTTIDGNNGYLIPGLAEMHAHVPSSSRGEQYRRDVMILFLANGVTTIRGMLGEASHLELREQLLQRQLPGPQLVTSGPSFNGRSVTSPKQASERVRVQAEQGYDFLKLHPGLLAQEYAAINQSADAAGISFAGHVSVDVGIEATLAAGQATIDHLDGYAQQMMPESAGLYGVAPSFFGINLSADMSADFAQPLAKATAAAGVWNVPTQSLFENLFGGDELEVLLARPDMRYIGAGLRDNWISSTVRSREGISPELQEHFLDVRRQLIGALQHAGAGLLLGSDAPQIMNVPGFSLHHELEFMVQAGLTPLQALQSGTINPARFFGQSEQGNIAAGMLADLVLLQNNPLENISNSKGIMGVMRGGDWYSREQLDLLLQAVESRGL